MTDREARILIRARIARAIDRLESARIALEESGPGEAVEIALVHAQSEAMEAEKLNSQAIYDLLYR